MSIMRKHLLWVVLAALLALFAAGCAKEVEPEATTPETETSSTEPKTEEPEELPPLKQEPEEGDDVAILETDKGRIVLMFYPSRAPNHVENFKKLVSSGFYDGTRFHRNIAGFMIQGGDPNSKDLENFRNVGPTNPTSVGTGGQRDEMDNEINIDAEFSDIRHVRGVLSMARGPSEDSASSQFFIMVAPNSGLDGQYSAFGKVVEGLDVVDEIVKTGNPNDNGATKAEDAVMIKKATMATWPIEGNTEAAGE